MSVHYLEQYLLKDDVAAGERLLEYPWYRNVVRQIATQQTQTRNCPHQLDDAVLEAQLRVAERVRHSKFISAFFYRAFEAHGGRISRPGHHRFEILEIPAVIYQRAAQLCPEMPIALPHSQVCFSERYVALPNRAPATLLSCRHPLRIATISLAVGEAGVSAEMVREFYSWTYKVAQNSIKDYLKRAQRQLYSLDQESPSTGHLRLDDVQDQSNDIWELLEHLELEALIKEIDHQYPARQYLSWWRGVVANQTQKEIAKELGIAQATLANRRRELEIRLSERYGLIDAAQAASRIRSIRRSTPIDRSDTGY